MKICQNCNENFEQNSGKQKFCSDKCKVAYARKTAKQIKGVTTADKIPEPEKESAENKNSYTWVDEIEKFCNELGITPKDLIESFKSKKVIKKEYVSNSEKLNISNHSGASNFLSDLRKKKCGL